MHTITVTGLGTVMLILGDFCWKAASWFFL